MRISSQIYALAVVAQFVIGTFVFGTIYALVLHAFGWPGSILVCGAIGLVHGLLVGLSLPIIEKIDPGIRSGRIADPGIFAKNYGAIAPFGLVAAHIFYGIIYGLIYPDSGGLSFGSAWLAGFVGTIGITGFVFAGKLLGITSIGPTDFLAASLDAVLGRHRPRATA